MDVSGRTTQETKSSSCRKIPPSPFIPYFIFIDGIVAISAVVAEAAFGINSASIPKAIAIIIASAIFLCVFFMISAVKLFCGCF